MLLPAVATAVGRAVRELPAVKDAMPKTSEDFALFNVRLPADTVERIQRYRDYLNQTQPGIEASASTAARMLLFRALEQVEEEMGIPKRTVKIDSRELRRKK